MPLYLSVWMRYGGRVMENKGEEGARVDVWGNQIKTNGHSKEEEEWMMESMHRSFP